MNEGTSYPHDMNLNRLMRVKELNKYILIALTSLLGFDYEL